MKKSVKKKNVWAPSSPEADEGSVPMPFNAEFQGTRLFFVVFIFGPTFVVRTANSSIEMRVFATGARPN